MKTIDTVGAANWGATVESAGAFEQMQAYVLDLYRGVDPVESFVETDGQVIDCIREDMHPAARRWDGLAIAPAESPPQVPESHEPAPPDPRSGSMRSPSATATNCSPLGSFR